MKLIVEATVAGKSQVLADGLVRVHVTDMATGATVGRLSLTEGVWTWMRDWIIAAESMGVIGPGVDMEIEVREREHSPDDGKRSETMRGRLLAAVGEAAEKRDRIGQDAATGTGAAETQSDARDKRGEARKGQIGALWQQVQQAGIQKRRK